MQFRVGERRLRRGIVLALAITFVPQSMFDVGSRVLGANEPEVGSSTIVEGPASTNLEPPLAGPGVPLDVEASDVSASTVNDPHLERGDIRPPEPEPVGRPASNTTDRHTTTTNKGNGIFESTTSPDPVNFQDAKGDWQPIDLSLVVNDGDPTFTKRTRANDRSLELADTTGPALARLSGGKYSLTLGSPDLDGAARATAHGGGFRYRGDADKTIEIVPTADGLYFTATLDSAAANLATEFSIEAAGLGPEVQPDGGVSFRDEGANRLIYAVAPAVAIDARGVTAPVTVSIGDEPVRESSSGVVLRYSISAKEAARLTYPVVLDPTITLWPNDNTQTIRVVNGADGSPVVGVSVAVASPANGTVDTSFGVCHDAQTQADGTCRISAVNPDLGLVLSLAKTGYFDKTVTVSPTPGATITITIWSDDSTQTIKVVSGVDGSPLTGVAVAVASPANGTVDTSFGVCHLSRTEADGTCRIKDVNPDLGLVLSLTKSSYFAKTVTVSPTPGATITITVWPTNTIQTLKVVNGTGGAALQGVAVSLAGSATGSGGTCVTSGTAADGTCVINSVNPDMTITAGLTKSSYFAKAVTVSPTPGATITITVWPTNTTQTIKVVNGTGGAALQGVAVSLAGSATGSGGTCVTSGTATDGTCVINSVNPDLTITAGLTKSSYLAKTVTVSPTPGATITITVWPTNTTQTIKVVNGISGALVSGARISSITNGTADTTLCKTSSTVMTESDGTCLINSVNPDLSLVVAFTGSTDSGSYFAKTVTVGPTPGATITITIWPTNTTQTIKVVNGLSGALVGGARISSITNGTADTDLCKTSSTVMTESDGTCLINTVNPDLSLVVAFTGTANGGNFFAKTVTLLPANDTIVIGLVGGSGGDPRNVAVGVGSSGTYAGNASTSLSLGGSASYGRVYLSFAPPILPDGGQVFSAVLSIRKTTTGTDPVAVLPVTSGWDPAAIRWGTQPGVGTSLATITPPAGTGTLTANVTSWAKATFTRNPQSDSPQWGFSLRSTREDLGSSSAWSIAGNGATTIADRPTLTVQYRIVSGTIGFAPSLGPNFQPSTFLVGRTTTLPLVVTNTTWWTWQTGGADKIGIGYRWLDPDNNLLAIPGFDPEGSIDLPGSSVPPNGTLAVDLPIVAPASVVQAKLRLDLITTKDAGVQYFSDAAQPSLYWAPAKPAGSDSGFANYVGLSVVQKNEYPVEVTDDLSSVSVETQLADGGSLAIDALVGNLTYEASDLVVSDRGPDLEFGRTYNSALLADCAGILKACGWSTQADERMLNPLSGTPVYIDRDGRRHVGATDAVGQIGFAGAPGGDLSRRRVTLLDEVRRTGWTGTTPSVVTSPVAAGTFAYQIPNATSATLPGLAIGLHSYPTISWKTQTTSANSSAVVFTILDSAGREVSLAYVHGTSFPTGATYTIIDAAGSSVGAFVTSSHDVYADVRAADPTLGRELRLTALTLVAPAGAGATTFDAVTMLPRTTTYLADTWTGYWGTLETSDVFAGTTALEVVTYAGLTMPSTDLATNPFLTWAWKKGSGSTVTIKATVTNLATNQSRTIVYYAGAASASGDVNIPIGSGLPGTWTQVTRNVLDDARRSFAGWSDPAGATGGLDPGLSGPHGDFYRVSAVELSNVGAVALFDAIAFGSVPSVATGDTAHEWALDDGHGGTTYFNEGGRLDRIVDASGNSQVYDWTYTASTDSWQLTRVRQGYDAARALTLGYPSAGVTTVTDVGGRVVTYTVSGTDLVSAQSFRGGTTLYGYDAAHRLNSLKDPRYTVGNDYRTTVAYDGGGLATAIHQGAVAANVPIAKVLNRTSGLVAGLTGLQIQTPEHLAAGASGVIEVDPNGSTVNEYVPKPGTTLPTSADLRIAHEHDGLAQATRITRYRTTGQTNPLVERTGSNAEATLDAFRLPMTTTRTMWTQNPVEYAKSTDPAKLQYRTVLAYDANNEVVARSDALGRVVRTVYDASHRPILVDDTFVSNSGFASNLGSWNVGGSATWSNTAGSGDGYYNGGASLPSGASLSQVMTLAPGQTFHLQADGKSGVAISIDYGYAGTYWLALATMPAFSGSTYTTQASTYTIPYNGADGRILVKVTGATGGALDNVLVRTMGTAITYDAFGNPTMSTDLLGRVTRTDYDADPGGNFGASVYLTRIVLNEVGGGVNADQNATTTLTRNRLGNVLTSTDPIGRTTTSAYAANGTDLVSATDAAGGQATYTHDVGGRVLTSVAPNGNAAGGSPSQHTTTRAYDGMGRLVDLTDTLGKVSHTDYDVSGQPVAVFENHTGGGAPLSGITNLKTTTTYDGDGVPTTTVVDAGAGNLNLTTSYGYDQLSRKLTETDPAGRVTTTYYDTAGLAAGVRLPVAPTGAPATLCPGSATVRCNWVTYAFDVMGRPTITADPHGFHDFASYDLDGRTVRTSRDGYVQQTFYRYDLAGRLVATTDPLGRVTTQAYDALDRPTIQTAPDGSFTKTAYDKAGQIIDTSQAAVAGTLDANLNWTHATYDNAGRVLTVTAHYVAGGSSTADQNVVVSANTYDANGNTLTSTAPPGAVGGSGMVTKATFDALDRTTQIITNYVSGGPSDAQTNLTTGYAYDTLGHRVTETDPAGVVTRSEYDRAHRLSAVVQNFLSGQPATAAQNVRSTYGYNANGELTNYCPPVSVQAGNCLSAFWAYGRDGFGNVSSQSAPTGSSLGAISATYDTSNRLASSSDGLHSQTYTYGWATNNITQIQASGGGAATVSYTYGYDAADRRTSAANGSDSLTFEYDSLDRPTAIKRAGLTVSGATYNPDGTIATSIQPAGTATFTYDGLQRLASAAMPALFSGSATFTWRPDGLLGARAWPAGTNEAFSYDAAKRPSQLQVKTSGGTTIATFTTAFDKVGNVTSESQVIPGQAGLAGNSTLAFSNDPLRRVTGFSVNGGAATTYTYDASSNRLSAGSTTFTYNTADQLINQTKAGVTRSFSHDAAGNQTSSPVSPTTNSTFTYDAVNKPLTTTVPGQSAVTYTYDALGRRHTRTVSGSTETYGYVGDAIARIDRGAGNITDSAIDAMGDRLTVGGAWTLPNVRGDVAALLNSGQTAVSDAYRYDPFGVSLATAGATTNPYRFQGRLLESTSGQYDFGARQYDPAIAAFTSVDSVMGAAQNPISLNRYLYAHANPESMIDPDGHWAVPLGSRAEWSRAIAEASAALAAARRALTAARLKLNAASGRVVRAQSRVNDQCPMVPCPLAYRKEWKQSRLDELAVAVSARTTARARYEAAERAVGAAERQLAAARAAGGRQAQPGVAQTVVGGVSKGLVGTVTGTIHTVTHLDLIPGQFAQAFSDPFGNFGRGIEAFGAMSDEDKIAFATQVVAGAAITKGAGAVVGRAVGAVRASAAGAAARSGVTLDEAGLAARVNEIHGALDPIAQNSRTTVVLGTQEGPSVIASGVRDLSPVQRALTGPGDVLGRLPGSHAEVTALDAASKAGLTPSQMAVSRPICSSCQLVIEESGGVVSSNGMWAWWKR